MKNQIYKLFFLVFFLIVYLKPLKPQLKEVYEQVYFNNGGFFNPAKIAPNANFINNDDLYLTEEKIYEEEKNQKKVKINFFLNSPYSNSLNGALENYMLSVNNRMGKNGCVGIFLDKYSFGLFKRFSYSVKYGYQIIFNENVKIAAGLSIGNINNSISVSNIILPTNSKDIFEDLRVREFNNNANQFYSDVGINFMYRDFNIEFVKFHINDNLNTEYIQEDPNFLSSLNYSFKLDLIKIKTSLGLVTYFNKTVDKIFFVNKFIYNDKALILSTNTLQQHTIMLELPINDNFLFYIGGSFGGYYANYIYDGLGNLTAGLNISF